VPFIDENHKSHGGYEETNEAVWSVALSIQGVGGKHCAGA
jgi:hypothetical protein